MSALSFAPGAARAATPLQRTWFVVEHNLRRLKNYGGTVVVGALGGPALYIFAFGIGLGSLISANLGPDAVDGVSYLRFVAPALLCSAALQVAAEEFTFTIMMGFKWNPIFLGMNAAPIGGGEIANGIAIFVAIRMAITCLLYALVMLLFGAISSPVGLLAVVAGIATGLAFGLPLMAYSASLAEDRGQFALVQRFIVVPLTLFSGTVFPLTNLPIWLQWIGWISPLWHGSQLARLAAYGSVQPGWLIAVHVVVLVVLATIGWLLARRIITARLDK